MDDKEREMVLKKDTRSIGCEGMVALYISSQFFLVINQQLKTVKCLNVFKIDTVVESLQYHSKLYKSTYLATRQSCCIVLTASNRHTTSSAY